MGGLRFNALDADRTKAHEVFYCPFAPDTKLISSVPFPDGRTNLADALSGPGQPIGTQQAEEVYLHIAYTYYGGLHEVANNPAEDLNTQSSTSDELRQHILRKRQMCARLDAHSGKILMADTVMYWAGGAPEWRINHGPGWGYTRGASVTQFRPPRVDGANELFGDAHVEWKNPRHFRELTDLPTGFAGVSGLLNNSMLHQGADQNWW
jgi:hypothetical protein